RDIPHIRSEALFEEPVVPEDLRLALLLEAGQPGALSNSLRTSEVVGVAAEQAACLFDQPPEQLGLAALVLPDMPELMDEGGLVGEVRRLAGPLEPDHVVARPPGPGRAAHQPASHDPDLVEVDGRSVEHAGPLEPLIDRADRHRELMGGGTTGGGHRVVAPGGEG